MQSAAGGGWDIPVALTCLDYLAVPLILTPQQTTPHIQELVCYDVCRRGRAQAVGAPKMC
jgi:hypothetical protein